MHNINENGMIKLLKNIGVGQNPKKILTSPTFTLNPAGFPSCTLLN